MPTSVYDQLRRDILSGERPPGSALVETALADHYGVSRTPIREALSQLRQNGLVERNGRGLAVRKQSPEEILEIYEVRIPLEELAARSAAARRTEFDLARLARVHRDMQELETDDRAARATVNRAFHRQIWIAGHNRTLIDLLERINDQLHRHPESPLGFPGRWEQVLLDHEELIAAIDDQQPDLAGELAAHHMKAGRNIRLQMYSG
ncbi:MAG: GntR family transcriptional regulator [Acidimicrobiales bacterium]